MTKVRKVKPAPCKKMEKVVRIKRREVDGG
jgi:hypothetical protein